ncbi:MAG: DHA2 family efflux MFS transporter permease subunit [Thermoleophilia bacterium]|nr:DHA2 family efflux MFS transporter permease subunit [Thermoleophilia bacterium]
MSQETGATHPPEDRGIDAAVLRIAGVVVLGIIMSILDMTIVNVALPTFQQVFGDPGAPLTYSHAAWSVTAYTLALATVIPLTGWAADRFGTKRLYIAAIAMFTVGSVLCATAWDMNALIAFRVVQGLGGGMLMPLGMTILTRAAGPYRMGRLMAILGIPILLGPILGPVLGGWLIEAVSWHWIFLVNLPVGIIALAYAWWALPADEAKPSESFDFLGMALLSPGLASFLFGVSSIPEKGTAADPWVWVPAGIGLALMALFVVHALRADHPLLDLRMLRERTLTVPMITLFAYISAFFGGLLLVPTYFQEVRGESTLHAGLLVAPQGIGAMLTMPLVGRLSDRMPIGRIVPVGIGVVCVGIFLLAHVGAGTPYWQIMGTLFLIGLGMGCVTMPLFTSAMRALKPHQVARGSTLLNINQQIASSVGVALMSVILTSHLKDADLALPAIAAQRDPAVAQQLGPRGMMEGLSQAASAFGTTFWVALALVAFALIPALMLPRRPESHHVRVVGEDDEQAGEPVMVH